jgi:hypothetical protein
MLKHIDFSVVARNCGRLPKPWRWEIYRVGRKTPIERSNVCFKTMPEAERHGQQTLSLLLSESAERSYPNEASRNA